jgi:hypothetical protein
MYNYPGSAAWKLSDPQPQRGYQEFYAMAKDVPGLYQTALDNKVPRPALTTLPARITADSEDFEIQVLSFGGRPTSPQVLITGGIHAREWIGTEMTYLLAEYLVMNYSSATTGLSPYQQAIQKILDKRRIHIVPMVNPAGNQYSVMSGEKGARTWRRNRRRLPMAGAGWQTALTVPVSGTPQAPFQNVLDDAGTARYDVPRYRSAPTQYNELTLPNTETIGVDINRNFSSRAFGFSAGPKYTNGVPNTESYFGTAAHSEVETANVETFLSQDGVAGWISTSIDYHSYSKFILYPSEESYEGAVDGNYVNLGEVLQRLIMPSLVWAGRYDYQLGTPIQLVKYDATGTIADWVGQKNPSRSFTIELDPGPGAGLQGFELPPDQIMGVFEKNIRGALALLVAGDRQTTVTNEAATTRGTFDRRTISSAERGLLDWNVYGRGNQLPVWP